MARNLYDFKLSAEELDYLQQLALRDATIASVLKLPTSAGPGRATIQLGQDEAEQLRESLTRQLAEIGFDEKYRLNDQGKMLEKLIDRFYLD